MAPLSSVLPDVCAKLRPAVAPGAVELHLNKKALDLGSPFRLLNVPAGSRLDIVPRGICVFFFLRFAAGLPLLLMTLKQTH